MIVRRQMFDDLGQKFLVFCDQSPLGSALGGVAERIERRAAQDLELLQHARRPPSIHGPNDIFFGSPVAVSRRASSGGAR